MRLALTTPDSMESVVRRSFTMYGSRCSSRASTGNAVSYGHAVIEAYNRAEKLPTDQR